MPQLLALANYSHVHHLKIFNELRKLESTLRATKIKVALLFFIVLCFQGHFDKELNGNGNYN